MKFSPLQLKRYLLPEITCAANDKYDPEKPSELRDESFKAAGQLYPMESKKPKDYSAWSLEFELAQKPDEAANVPYFFKVKLVGLFHFRTGEGDVTPEVFVQTNGSSILYGIAREILRGLTAVGPWDNMLLPTVSFYNQESAIKEPEKKLKGPKAKKA